MIYVCKCVHGFKMIDVHNYQFCSICVAEEFLGYSVLMSVSEICLCWHMPKSTILIIFVTFFKFFHIKSAKYSNVTQTSVSKYIYNNFALVDN